MSRVPITVIGYKCDRCGHEWIPRGESDTEPKVCPKCKSAYWNSPRKKTATTYEDFRDRIRDTILAAQEPLTWTEIRTRAKLPQAFPNNKWVKTLETDIGLLRTRDKSGIINWSLKQGMTSSEPPGIPLPPRSTNRRAKSKQGSLELNEKKG